MRRPAGFAITPAPEPLLENGTRIPRRPFLPRPVRPAARSRVGARWSWASSTSRPIRSRMAACFAGEPRPPSRRPSASRPRARRSSISAANRRGPGHVPVPAEEEQARVLPVIRGAGAAPAVPISIDTYKASTARVALRAGARIVNDVWGLQREPDIAHVAAEHGAPVIVMHNRETIDAGARHRSTSMLRFFERSLAIARRAGIPDGDIVLDPGIGFGKTLAAAPRRAAAPARDPRPGLPGPGRRLAQIAARPHCTTARPRPATGSTDRSPPHALAATLGADIVRVHDVAAHVDAMRVVDAVMRPERPDEHDRIGVDPHRGVRASRRAARGGRARPALLRLARCAARPCAGRALRRRRPHGQLRGPHRDRRHDRDASAGSTSSRLSPRRSRRRSSNAIAMVEAITIRIDKPSAPVPAILDGVSVEITRHRGARA